MPTDGVVPLCATFDHVGPIAKSVADAAALWAVLAGRVPRPIESPKPADVTLGVLGDYFTLLLESDVRSAFDRAIARLRTSGIRLVNRAVANTDAIVDTYVNISLPEAAHWHAPTLDSRPDDYQPPVRERLERGRTISAVSYLRAREVRQSLTRSVDSALEGCGVLVLPTLPIVAPLLGAAEVTMDAGPSATLLVRAAMLRLTQLFNMTGHPAISIPIPTSGLPVGLQLVGRRERTSDLLAVATDLRARASRGGSMRVSVGQRAERSLTLTKEHVATFAKLTGDYNPLHFDEPFAAKTKFGRLVVQGGLTTGLLHALVAMDMPGPGTVFLSQNWKFIAPVYIDDTITASAEVLSVHASKPVTQLAIRVTRQTGEVVLEGEAWCYTFEPRPE